MNGVAVPVGHGGSSIEATIVGHLVVLWLGLYEGDLEAVRNFEFEDG